MDKMHLILRDLRKARGLSQAEMAKLLGVSKSAISMYELGERAPYYEILRKYAELFNVDFNYLHGYNNGLTAPSEPQLNDGEERLLELFRSVPEQDRDLVLQMIEVALSNKR